MVIMGEHSATQHVGKVPHGKNVGQVVFSRWRVNRQAQMSPGDRVVQLDVMK